MHRLHRGPAERGRHRDARSARASPSGRTSSRGCPAAARRRRCCSTATSTSSRTAGQNWSHPPFEAVEARRLHLGPGRGRHEGRRGDDARRAACARARRASSPPGDVIFCALADEEGLGGYGADWLVREHADLFDGVRYAIGEFGGFTMHAGGRRFYPIQVAEKQVCTVRMTIRGPPGTARCRCAAAPWRARAGAPAARPRRLPVHVTPVVREMSRRWPVRCRAAHGAVLRQLLRPALTDRAARPPGRPRPHARPDAAQHRQPDDAETATTSST